MGLVDDFFKPWEKQIGSFEEINDVLQSLFERWVSQGRQFAWRGVVNASWPLHSSLYRRVLWTRSGTKAPDEATLVREEGELLAQVHRWGLHHGLTGRLSILSQLATLQHFGAPTRLVDVTLNAYIGLWFAVEERYVDGEATHADTDGRLLAVDITNRLMNEDGSLRDWEDDLHRPWKELDRKEWTAKTLAWKPAAFQARIASQQGAFLLGGVPSSELSWPKEPRSDSPFWRVDEVRRCTSLPLRFHKAEPGGGGVGKKGQPAYTFRITASAKRDIRERLGKVFGYSHQTMFPDYPGFAEYGMPLLRSSSR